MESWWNYHFLFFFVVFSFYYYYYYFIIIIIIIILLKCYSPLYTLATKSILHSFRFQTTLCQFLIPIVFGSSHSHGFIFYVISLVYLFRPFWLLLFVLAVFLYLSCNMSIPSQCKRPVSSCLLLFSRNGVITATGRSKESKRNARHCHCLLQQSIDPASVASVWSLLATWLSYTVFMLLIERLPREFGVIVQLNAWLCFFTITFGFFF